MRLFVALALPSSSVSDLERVVAPLRPAWPGLRWTGQEAWHLTLAFLGEVEDGLESRLGTRLERAAARHPSLLLSLGGAGAFPAPGRARVLWAGIQGDRRGLAALAASVAAGSRRAGAPPSGAGRRYQPHLTLARCRAPADVRPLVEQLSGYDGRPWTASEVYLIRSRPDGEPRYQTLGTWPLRAPPGSH
ncbi:MAG TPA: RNA 2',3'-cyclic phosphodiesterase [Streptosporangiaceae bacterium]|nr:RNA 2',3'-cyclic phosphodiesterase [Streptosporangiaceae bacterium]